MVLLEMDKDNFKRELGRLKDLLDQNGGGKELSPIRGGAAAMGIGGSTAGGPFNMMARSNRNMSTLNKANNRISAPLGGLTGFKKPAANLPTIGQLNSAPPRGSVKKAGR